jgi:hypothetical protein
MSEFLLSHVLKGNRFSSTLERTFHSKTLGHASVQTALAANAECALGEKINNTNTYSHQQRSNRIQSYTYEEHKGKSTKNNNENFFTSIRKKNNF